MTGYAARRALAAIPTLLAVLTLVFLLVRVVPGDPAVAMLGDRATPAAVAALHARLGLDAPIVVQYLRFVGECLRGDFGASMITGRPVVSEIASILPYTLELSAAAMAIGVLIGGPIGVLAAVYHRRLPDLVIRFVSLLALSFPVFVSGIFLLLLLALHWRLFPVIGAAAGDDLAHRLWRLTLPALTLGLVMAAYVTRVARSAMIGVLREDYIRTARAKGVSRRLAVWRHGVRNAGAPVVTVVGVYVGILIGNSVLTEIVFSRPGLGSLIINALTQRDYTMLQGLMVVYCLLVVAVNVVTDLAYGVIDPRVTHA